MDPITLALLGSGAISAVSGIAQYLQSKGATNANQSDLNQLKDLASKIQQPNFNVASIPPAQLKVLQQYSPSIAQYVPQKSPELVKAMSAGAQAGRGAQNAALDTYSRTASTGSDALNDAAQQKALHQAEANTGSAIATTNQRLQQQGMGTGSGLGYASQIAQASGSQDALANAGQQNASDQYNRRMLATQNQASLGGQIRNEDVSQEQANANTLNDFNRNVASMGNQYNQYAAGVQNQGQQYNLQNNQDVYNQNKTNEYTNNVANRNYGNTQAQQTYGNSINKLNTQFGLTNMQNTQNTQASQNNNRAIQGLGDAANTGVMAYNSYSRKPKDPSQGTY